MSETQIANELLHGNLCGSQHFLFEPPHRQPQAQQQPPQYRQPWAQQQQQQQRLDQHTLEQQRQKARRSASLNILCALQDFASTKILPKGWDNIPANHPFLGVEQDPHEGPIGGDLTNQHSESGLALKLIVRLSLEGVEL